MYFIGSILVFFVHIASIIVEAYTWVIIISAIMSWFNPDPYNPIVRFIRQITVPLYIKVRNLLPRSWLRSGIDFSPFLILIALFFLNSVVLSNLYHYGKNLQTSSSHSEGYYPTQSEGPDRIVTE